MNSALALPTSLLFIDNTEVGIPFTKFAKATPASKNHAKSTTRLSDSTLTQFELKSANPMPIMNSTHKNSKVSIWFADFQSFLYSPQKFLNSSNPMPTMNSASQYFEIGIRLADFHPSFSPMSNSLLKLTSSDIDIWTVDFPLNSPEMSISS